MIFEQVQQRIKEFDARDAQYTDYQRDLFDKFERATGNENYDEALLLVQDPQFPVNRWDYEGFIPLELVGFRAGSAKVMKVLIEKGADLNAIAYNGQETIFQKIIGSGYWPEILVYTLETANKRGIPLDNVEISRAARLSINEVLKITALGVPFQTSSRLLKNQLQEANRQFLKHVILPTIVLDAENPEEILKLSENQIYEIEDELGYPPGLINFIIPSDAAIIDKAVKNWRQAGKTTEEITQLLAQEPNTKSIIRMLSVETGLDDCWHHPGISIPREEFPLLADRTWHAFVPTPCQASNGLSLRSLTSTHELTEESRLLDHCVGRSTEYDSKCCREQHDERSHIFSIFSEKDGIKKSLSTLEIKLVPLDEAESTDTRVGDTQWCFRILQHYGRGNGSPPAEALAAWSEIQDGIRSGNIPVITDNDSLGETAESKAYRPNCAPIEYICGYSITPESVRHKFDLFRMSERAAIKPNTGTRHRVYQVERTEDGYDVLDHFIDGYAAIDADGKATGKMARRYGAIKTEAGEKIAHLRTLGLDSWINIQGYREEIRKAVEEVLPTIRWKSRDAKIDTTSRDIPNKKKPETKVDSVSLASKLEKANNFFRGSAID
jgi:hypothetical protein